jgi:hypothetical protein
MSGDPIELARLQRWLQAVITHPAGVEAGIESDTARREIALDCRQLEQVITRSRALTSIERLRVYGNAYYARLLECLRDEFPALVHAAGAEAFDGFAFGYLQRYPSTSYTLGQLGRDFPTYLAETKPQPAQATDQPDWADFLIDLARLERTYSEVFDGPGTEGERLLDSEQLARVSLERWPGARLVPVECLRLMSFHYPVHEYATAVRQGNKPQPPDRSPTYLIISRRDYIVRRAAVSREQFELLQALAAGTPVAAAIEQSALAEQADLEALATSLREWFKTWASAGYFRRIEWAE